MVFITFSWQYSQVKVPGPAEMEMYMDENEEKHIVPLVDPASGVLVL